MRLSTFTGGQEGKQHFYRVSSGLTSKPSASQLKDKLKLSDAWYIRKSNVRGSSGDRYTYFILQATTPSSSDLHRIQLRLASTKPFMSVQSVKKVKEVVVPVTVSNLPWDKPTKFGSRSSAEHGARTVVNNARDRQLENEASAWDLVQMEHPTGILEDVSELYEQLGADILVFSEDEDDELIAVYDSKSGKYIGASQFKHAVRRLEEEGVFTTLVGQKARIVVTPNMPKRVQSWAL